MNRAMEKRLVRLLGAVCVVEILLAAYGLLASPLPVAAGSGRDGRAEGDALEIVSRVDARPRESFKAMVDRPIFVASRRPSAQPGPDAGAAGAADGVAFGRYRFTGVVFTPKLRIAFVTDGDTNGSSALSEGDRLGDWTIMEIRRDGITLQSQERRETVLFRKGP